MDDLRLESLPMPLRWLVPPRSHEVAGTRLVIEAAGGTDWFADPSGETDPVLNAPALVGEVLGDFVLRSRIGVAFRSAFDAGVLMVHVQDETWAKLCFEFSPQRDPTIVSVVTNGRSDDANAFTVDGNRAWLRVARIGPACAFHASTDGLTWHLVRYFALPGGAEASVGFEAQSPSGLGCVVTFDEIGFERRRLADLRDGT
jgi:uncharacterized protein